MSISIEVSYRRLFPSDEINYLVRERARALAKTNPDLTGCHVVVERRDQRKAPSGCRVRVELISSNDVIVGTSSAEGIELEETHRCAEEAFREAMHRLQLAPAVEMAS